MKWAAAIAAAYLLLAPRSAAAHEPSAAHLRLTTADERILARLEIAVRDLDAAVTLDANGDGAVTWGEITDAESQVHAYISRHVRLGADGAACAATFQTISLVGRSDGPYVVAPFIATCARPVRVVDLSYDLLFAIDAQHRGIVHLAGGEGQTRLVTDSTPLRLEAAGRTSITHFVREGVWHIWHGLDHILFLTCLLLPAVYVGRRRPGTERGLRDVAVDVLAVVTAFTLAHSITLVISAVGYVQLPSRWVETAIALSVVAVAVNNLVRAIDSRWAIAFTLGLLHGFGFSSVLLDVGLPPQQVVGALLGFNLGVELGQVLFVLALLPVLYTIRHTWLYRVVLWGGSAAVAAIGLFWAIQRWSS